MAKEITRATPDSSAMIELPSTFTPDQNAQVPQAPLPRALVRKDDEIQDEIPLEVLDISLQFVGLPKEEIVNIFQNKFKPINLYRLRHMRGLSFKAYKDGERIGIEDGLLNLRKNSGLYKDYGNSFYEVWSEAFINYTSILVSLFGATVLHLQAAFTQFYGQVLRLSKVYDWKEALLPMAIEVHSQIVTQQSTNPKQWVILPEFRGRFCPSMTVIGMNSLLGPTKQKRSQSPPTCRGEKQTGSTTNNPSVVCDLFNKGSCRWVGCKRAHKCKGCGSKEHGFGSCTKRK